jgi:hypothetical protein
MRGPLDRRKEIMSMRMLDTDGDRSVHQLQLYLTPREAQELRTALDRLLADPEANEHEHVRNVG